MTEPLARQTITALETALDLSKRLIQRLKTELSRQAAWVEGAVRDYDRLSAALRRHGRKNLSWEDTISETISVMDEASPERAESSMTRILRLEKTIHGLLSTAEAHAKEQAPDGTEYRLVVLTEARLNSMRLLLGMEPTTTLPEERG
jgi:hypothetical protein